MIIYVTVNYIYDYHHEPKTSRDAGNKTFFDPIVYISVIMCAVTLEEVFVFSILIRRALIKILSLPKWTQVWKYSLTTEVSSGNPWQEVGSVR